MSGQKRDKIKQKRTRGSFSQCKETIPAGTKLMKRDRIINPGVHLLKAFLKKENSLRTKTIKQVENVKSESPELLKTRLVAVGVNSF